MHTFSDGTQEWRLGGKLHRRGDQPALILASGTQAWYLNGKRHRVGDQPARIWANGTREWWRNGKLHREGDQPTVICADGTQMWYLHGQRHREGGKPTIHWADGTQEWWTDGKRTRTTRVTDFRKTSDRFALVQAVVRVGVTACVPRATGSAVGGLLQAVHALPRDASSYHVAHEHAFLVALFL